MLEFAREKIKPEGISKGNCLGRPGTSQQTQLTPSPCWGATGQRMGKGHPCVTYRGFFRCINSSSSPALTVNISHPSLHVRLELSAAACTLHPAAPCPWPARQLPPGREHSTLAREKSTFLSFTPAPINYQANSWGLSAAQPASCSIQKSKRLQSPFQGGCCWGDTRQSPVPRLCLRLSGPPAPAPMAWQDLSSSRAGTQRQPGCPDTTSGSPTQPRVPLQDALSEPSLVACTRPQLPRGK